MALLLINAGATVTVCNSKTRDLAFHTKRADILVAAIGKPVSYTHLDVYKRQVHDDRNLIGEGRVVGDAVGNERGHDMAVSIFVL